MRKDTFNYSETRVLEAANEIIKINVKKSGQFICSQVISCTDETSSPARVDFGYVRGASFIPIKSHLLPAANFTLALETILFMAIDNIPAVRITTGVIGDRVQLAISGYVLYKDESME